MEQPIVTPIAPITGIVTPETTPVLTPIIEPSHESGGLMNKIGDFKIVEYITFALFISASIYSIYYHRQALNKINE